MACAGAPTIAAQQSTLYRPFIAVQGSTVQIVQSRYGFTSPFDQTWVFTSTNGGDSFDAGHQTGTVTAQEGTFGPGGTFTGASSADPAGGLVQTVTLAAGSTTGFATLFATSQGYNGNVGITSQGERVAVFADAGSNAQVRVQSSGDPNADASWGAASPIGYASYPRLATGPAGLFMLDGTANRGIEVRKWTGAFGPGATIAPDNSGGEVPVGAVEDRRAAEDPALHDLARAGQLRRHAHTRQEGRRGGA